MLATTVGGAGSGSFAAAASVALVMTNGTVESRMDSNAIVTGDATNITVTTDSLLNASSVAAAVAISGGGAGTAGLALTRNALTQNTSVDRGARVDLRGDSGTMKVQGKSTTTADSYLLGISGGSVALGLSAAIASVKPTLTTTVGVNGSGVTSLGKLKKLDINNDVDSEAETGILSLGVGYLSIQGNVLLVFNETDSTAKAAAVAGELGSLTVNSDLQAKGNASLITATVGAIPVGINVSYMDLDSRTRAQLNTDEFTASVAGDLNVTTGAGGRNKTEAVTIAVAGALGAGVLGINSSTTRNRAMNLAEISGGKGLNAGGTVNLKATATGSAKATLAGGDIGGASVGGSMVDTVNETAAQAKMKLGGALDANLVAKADVTGETEANLYTGCGAIVGVKINGATAEGKTSAVVDVDLAKASAKKVALNAYSHGSDHVTAKVGNQAYGGLSVAVVNADAVNRDVYSTRVKLGGGDAALSALNVKTEYDTGAEADLTPSLAGVDIDLVKVATNGSNAKNETWAGSELELADAEISVDGDLNVHTLGSATATAAVRPGTFQAGLIAVGVSRSEATVAAKQAAAMTLNGGKVARASTVDVKSLVKKSAANANLKYRA